MEQKVYYFYEASAIPFAQKWFEEIKIKHAQAGFSNHIFLREAYFLNIFGKINPESNWLAATSLNVAPDAQKYFNGNQTIDLIGAPAQDLLDLNAAAKNLYEDPENLTLENKNLLERAEGLLLHEIYHCIKPFKASGSFFNKIALPLCIMLQVIGYFSKTALLTSACSIGAYSTIFMAISLHVFNIMKLRHVEYLADMHAIKHGSVESIQGLIDFLEKFDQKLAHNRIFQSPILWLENCNHKAFTITKYFYAGCINILTAIQNFYIDAHHPAFATRKGYLTKALEQLKQ